MHFCQNDTYDLLLKSKLTNVRTFKVKSIADKNITNNRTNKIPQVERYVNDSIECKQNNLEKLFVVIVRKNLRLLLHC